MTEELKPVDGQDFATNLLMVMRNYIEVAGVVEGLRACAIVGGAYKGIIEFFGGITGEAALEPGLIELAHQQFEVSRKASLEGMAVTTHLHKEEEECELCKAQPGVH